MSTARIFGEAEEPRIPAGQLLGLGLCVPHWARPDWALTTGNPWRNKQWLRTLSTTTGNRLDTGQQLCDYAPGGGE
jgi:hypothetical protein